MAANNILTFAASGSALVLSQAAYAADAQRGIGHQPGTARAELQNKVTRQTSLLAAALAQFVADFQGADVVDTLTPAALAAMIVEAIRSSTAIPAGMSVWVPGTNPLPGTMEQNGSVVSRAAYPRLWAYAAGSGNIAPDDATWFSGNLFGGFSPGDGATTFRIPDLRGLGIRGWDHGRGLDPGRAIGSYQGDQNQSHAHGVNDPGHAHGYADSGHAHGVNDPGHFHFQETEYRNESGSGTPWGSGGGAFEGNFGWSTGTSGTGISISVAGAGISINAGATGISIQAQGGAEARGKSAALMPIIFY